MRVAVRSTRPAAARISRRAARCSPVPACAPAAQVREPHLSRAALAFLRTARRTPPGGVDALRRDRRRAGGARDGAPPAHGPAPRARAEIHTGPAGPAACGARGAAAGSGSEALTFQDLIFKLSQFWVAEGCILQQPLDLEVGAGTSHPETLLRVLGPAALERRLRAAVAAARRRPLRREPEPPVQAPPVPGDPQALARRGAAPLPPKPRGAAASTRGSTTSASRRTTGNRRRSARGASAGRCSSTASRSRSSRTSSRWAASTSSPIACEITYGLERIAMALQRVDNVYDMEWAPGVRYGAVRLREEVEHSKYAFGQVDVPREEFAAHHRDLFERHYAFCGVLLRSGLVLPALEECLKCSHLFNILDASGSVGVTERTAYILRVRQLAVAIAKAYVEGLDRAGTETTRHRLQAPGCRRRRPPARRSPAACSRQPAAHPNEPRTPHRTRPRRAPGELAAAAHAAARRGDGAAARGRAAGDRRAARGVQHAAPARRARVAASPSGSAISRSSITGPPVSAATGPDGQPTPAAARVREEERRGGRRSRARADTQGRVPGLPQAAARRRPPSMPCRPC